MRIRGPVVLSAILLWFCAPGAAAGEVVHFKNGTFLKVLSHRVEADMIRVQLDSGGSMAFPANMVDKIEGAFGKVWGGPTPQANQALPGERIDPNTPYPVTGAHQVPPRFRAAGEEHAAQRPPAKFAVPPGAALSGPDADAYFIDGSIMATYNQGGGDNPQGLRRLGTSYVIDEKNPMAGSKPFKPTRFGPKDVDLPLAPEPPPPPPDPED